MIRADATTRARERALKAELRQLQKPAREAQRQARKAARQPKEQRVQHENLKPTRGREIDKGYLAWLRRLPCAAGLVVGGCSGPVEAAHLRFADAARGRPNPGLSTKPSDRFATPLCNHHHQHDQHRRNERAFWNGLGIEPGELTDALYAAYQAGADGLAVLLRFARQGR